MEEFERLIRILSNQMFVRNYRLLTGIEQPQLLGLQFHPDWKLEEAGNQRLRKDLEAQGFRLSSNGIWIVWRKEEAR